MAFYGKQPSYYTSPSMEDNTDGQWMEVEDVSMIKLMGYLITVNEVVNIMTCIKIYALHSSTIIRMLPQILHIIEKLLV